MENKSEDAVAQTERKEFNDEMNVLRDKCRDIEQHVRSIKERIMKRVLHSEVPANLTLAFRHLEDARMRLGKAIQYNDDGISIYDKKNN